MIPKIIHLCWLSGDEYPDIIRKCLKTWELYLPDYKIIVWDTKRFDVNSVLWTKQAFETKKYAFAADYIRLYALYHYGGIYLDSDVIVYKSFDDLLDLPYFIGLDYTRSFEAAVIGAKKNTEWIEKILCYYNNRSFIKEDKTYDTYELPKIFYDILKINYNFRLVKKVTDFIDEPGTINVFHQDFFNSRDSVGVRKTRRSYCAHNYAGSWLEASGSWKDQVSRVMPKWLMRIYFFITHNTIKRNQLSVYSPKFLNK